MTRKRLAPFANYPTYFVVGTSIALFTIGVRQVLGWCLGDSHALGYILSMVVAYSLGIILSYIFQRRFTFTKRRGRTPGLERVLYVGTALLGMLLTVVFSLGLHSFLALVPILPEVHNNLAFAVAALATSVITYLINKFITFTEA
ncbi:GtrA family protein [Anthocerotibacter panamensis]|uniref:GtrA family protein n=1 Tax=Anthocerotibacter panamensis TaxID=2857077 RepID=UPI001C4082E7|nr:GtrA family protein [Anthocerotibacter panamensis]